MAQNFKYVTSLYVFSQSSLILKILFLLSHSDAVSSPFFLPVIELL